MMSTLKRGEGFTGEASPGEALPPGGGLPASPASSSPSDGVERSGGNRSRRRGRRLHVLHEVGKSRNFAGVIRLIGDLGAFAIEGIFKT